MHRNTAYEVVLLKLGNRAMHTIDELAHISGMPSRTIRFYNTQGMMPTPTMCERVAYYSKEHLMQQTGASEKRIDELTDQHLLFPIKTENGLLYSNDDILLLQLYERLEYLGLPIALPSLVRFQLRQLVRSEIAALEQHVQPRWREEGLSPEQQMEQFQMILTLTDTLISVMHRKLVYQL